MKICDERLKQLVRVVCAPLCFLFLFILGQPASAEDWPTYRHDMARSGVTSEALKLPLAANWEFKTRHPPRPAFDEAQPHYGGPTRKVQYDDVFRLVVSDSTLCFASSADHKVFCVDARTGRLRWVAFTGAPCRTAPAIVDGRVYVTSDDGTLYCFNLQNGKRLWQRRAWAGPDHR